MTDFYHSNFKVGILGGGQLGRMFIQEAVNLDLNVHILDSDTNAPCKAIANHFELGDIKDFDTVYQFGKEMDVVTIEIEHVNVDALEQLEQEGVRVFPQPKLIRMVQDKGLQKTFYKENGIPTSDFHLLKSKADLADYRDFFPCVQKLRKGGYDGKGVQVLKDPDQLDQAFDAPNLIEDFVDFEKELSVIVSRNEAGEIASYPIVELEFNPEANLVEFLFSPADVSKEIEQKAAAIAQSLIQKMELVGILAVEMFLTKDGEILVNEIAPRPHNSGHQSIEGNITSQYEQHMRSILNLPLGDTAIIKPSVMVNLLGEKGAEGNVNYQGLREVLGWSGVYPHIYGKKTVKSFRKMGHVTIINDSLEEAKTVALKVKETIKVLGQ
jgi:5-(carboxyamino)imidazole ribonucleotide synthase